MGLFGLFKKKNDNSNLEILESKNNKILDELSGIESSSMEDIANDVEKELESLKIEATNNPKKFDNSINHELHDIDLDDNDDELKKLEKEVNEEIKREKEMRKRK